jgi:photosystem II stability/assembly factor-like uncharacterized protein
MKSIFLLVFTCLLALSAQAQWETLEGPRSSNIQQLCYADNTLYGLSKHAIYRSTDEGYSWVLDRSFNPPDGMSVLGVKQLIVDGAERYMKLGAFNRCYRIESDGESVLLTGTDLFAGQEEVKIHASGGILYALTHSTIAYSLDRGTTWQGNNVSGNKTVFKGAIYLNKSGQLSRSFDFGIAWTRVGPTGVYLNGQLHNTDQHLFFVESTTKILYSSDGFEADQRIASAVSFSWVNKYQLLFNRNASIAAAHTDETGLSVALNTNNQWQVVLSAFKLQSTPTDYWLDNDHWVVCSPSGLLHSTDGGRSFTSDNTIPFVSTYIEQLHQNKGIVVFRDDNGEIVWRNDIQKDWKYFDPSLIAPYYPSSHNTWLAKSEQKFYYLVGNYLFSIAIHNDEWDRMELFSNTRWGDYSSLVAYDEDYYLLKFEETNTLSPGFFPLYGRSVVKGTTESNEFVKIALPDELNIPVGRSFLNKLRRTNAGIVYIEEAPMLGQPSNMAFITEDQNFSPTIEGNSCFPILGTSVQDWLEYDSKRLFSICQGQAYVYEMDNPGWQLWTPQNWEKGEPLYHKDIRFFRIYKGVFWIGVKGEGLYYATDPSGRFYKYDFQPPSLDVTAVDFDGNEIWVAAADGNIYHSRIQVRKSARVESPFIVQNSPAGDERIVLKSNTQQAGTTELSIFAATGQFIKSETLAAGNAWEITVPTAVPGMYFLHLKASDGEAFTEKWVAGR